MELFFTAQIRFGMTHVMFYLGCLPARAGLRGGGPSTGSMWMVTSAPGMISCMPPSITSVAVCASFRVIFLVCVMGFSSPEERPIIA